MWTIFLTYVQSAAISGNSCEALSLKNKFRQRAIEQSTVTAVVTTAAVVATDDVAKGLRRVAAQLRELLTLLFLHSEERT